jgi:hypothetical protein
VSQATEPFPEMVPEAGRPRAMAVDSMVVVMALAVSNECGVC